MTSTYSAENIKFADYLSRPSTTLGSVLVNDGTDFQQVTPTADGQILISDSAQASGARWTSPSESLSFAIPTGGLTIPTSGNSTFFFRFSSSSPVSLGFPNATCTNISVNTNNTGYSNTPTNITGGTLDFTLGSVPANTDPTSGNFVAYTGSPHFQINGVDINTSPTNYSQFTSTLSINTTEGDQVCMRLTNNLTTGGAITFRTLNVLLMFKLIGYTV